MKNKKYFAAVKILLYGILIINLVLIFISVNRSSMAILIFSQLTFILFICMAWLLIKRTPLYKFLRKKYRTGLSVV